MAELPGQDSTKQAKKLAKAEAKAAKKRAKTERAPVAGQAEAPPAHGVSPTERGARAAEQKVRLERWRTVIAAVAALIALATLLLMMLRRGC